MELYNGDCLEIMKSIPDKSVDLIICDLPYGCLTGQNINKGLMRMENGIATGKKAETKNGLLQGCPWDVKIDLHAFWEQVKRIRKSDKSPCLHFCTTKFGFELGASNPAEFRYDIVWTKTNAVGFLQANKMPMRSHEMIYVFSKKGAYYKRIDIEGDFPAGGGGRSTANFMPIAGMPNLGTTVAGKRCIKSYVEVANKKTRGGHPTAKPVDLYKFLLERYCPAGGTVLDPTFGSGNSGQAAKLLGLKYIGIEKDEAFFKKAKSILLPEAEVVIQL